MSYARNHQRRRLTTLLALACIINIYVLPVSALWRDGLPAHAAAPAQPDGAPAPNVVAGGNGKLTFTSTRDGGDQDIFVMNPDGGSQTNLDNNTSNENDPVWSPDGAKIAFSRGNDIFVMDAGGANQVNLTQGTGINSFPAWSPDGTKIAFARIVDIGLLKRNIFVMDAGGANVTNLTNDTSIDETRPAWSPNGAKIAFSRGNDIFVRDANGSNPVNLTNTSTSAGNEDNPAWSPDGTKISYNRSSGASVDNEIFVMNADGSGQTNLTNNPTFTDEQPAWSPDGTKIAYRRDVDPSGSLSFEIFVMNADGGNPTNLTNNSAQDTAPDWQAILPQTFTVNSTANTDDGNCASAAGGCTLREAINAANSHAGRDTIAFNIPGAGVHTIKPGSELPDITDPVVIDGYTQPGASANTLAAGTNAVLLIELNGASALNGPDGLTIAGGGTTVRGLVINGFKGVGNGIKLFNSGNVIEGNFIGTAPDGTTAKRNDGAGVSVSGPNSVIGGSTPGARNLISGNGIGIAFNSSTQGSVVTSNLIGTDKTGTAGILNAGEGVVVNSNNNVIGTADHPNVIAFNLGNGVGVSTGGTGNRISNNSIHSNNLLGIDLGRDGATANDAIDADAGANNLQNFPVLTSADVSGGALAATATLNSVASKTYTVEFFANDACDPSGNGEGQTFLGSAQATTDANGNANVNTSLPFPAGAGSFITSTATDPDGNTSEFSQCLQATVTAPTPTPTPTPSPTPTPTPSPTPATVVQFSSGAYSAFENQHSVEVTVTRSGVTNGETAVSYRTADGIASERSDYTTAAGTLTFAPGEVIKTFHVLITDDSHVEGNEPFAVALSDPTGGAALGTPDTAFITIVSDDTSPTAPNAIDASETFVREHYHDFLGREPDAAGLAFWTQGIESCGADAGCREVKRIHTSAAFFLSIEFQETGFFVMRMQRVALGRRSADATGRLTYLQFVRDSHAVAEGVVVGQPGADSLLEQNKQAYAARIVGSPEFAARFPAGQGAAEYVDALFASAAVTPTDAERQAAVAAFGAGGAAGRAAALRSAADSGSVRSAEYNAAFVLAEYFGYLRRNPTDAPDADDSGYQFWLVKLDSFGGDFVRAEMVRAFLVSAEYRRRFGQP